MKLGFRNMQEKLEKIRNSSKFYGCCCLVMKRRHLTSKIGLQCSCGYPLQCTLPNGVVKSETFNSKLLSYNKIGQFGKLDLVHGSYEWIIMLEKCGRPDLTVFHLIWVIGTYGNWKNQNPGGRFGATS